MENKKTIRSNRAQINYLCHYMAQNPSFAAGDFQTPLGAKNIKEQWLALKQALDELGPKRTVDQWKICWRDQKKKAREEGGALKKAKNKTGNFDVLPPMSENSSLVLNAIGKEMAVGCGPEESPIGFSQEKPSEAITSSQLVQKSPAPQRPRRTLPHDRFLNAQLELNNLIKELIKEVHRSNDLREERLNFMRGGTAENEAKK